MGGWGSKSTAGRDGLSEVVVETDDVNNPDKVRGLTRLYTAQTKRVREKRRDEYNHNKVCTD